MAIALKTKQKGAAKRRTPEVPQNNKPKRLSKAGQWRRENPGGIIVVLDRRAVNK